MTPRTVSICVASLCMALSLCLSSCVHEWPDLDKVEHNVFITVTHDTEWLPDYEMNLSRAEDGNYDLRYLFQIYPAGNEKDMIAEYIVHRDDFSRQDFIFSLPLGPGSYDIWAWEDVSESGTGASLFYEDTDFKGIRWLKPYAGNSEMKDAFRGKTNFTVEKSYEEQARNVYATLLLKRPLARYKFITTDLEDCLEKEMTKAQASGIIQNGEAASKAPFYSRLHDYTVKVIYPGYLPAVFNNFLGNPVDSWTGISFDARIKQLSDEDAQLGMDFVMVNGEESAVQVALEIYDPEGLLIGRTNTIYVPTRRSRTTLIYGRFLTTLRSDGVGINPDFDGEFNIEIK